MTDAIFDQLAIVNAAAVADPTVLRLSLDAKAGVKVGPFSRKGKNRIETAACDHDFAPKNTVIPYGIFLPEWDELFLYCTTSKVTSTLRRRSLDYSSRRHRAFSKHDDSRSTSASEY